MSRTRWFMTAAATVAAVAIAAPTTAMGGDNTAVNVNSELSDVLATQVASAGAAKEATPGPTAASSATPSVP